MSISIEDILLRASEFPSDSLVYVVADFGDGAYVLVSNKQIIYAISSTGQQSTKAPTIKTDYLELCTAIKLRPVDHSGGKVDENVFDFIRLIDSASRSEALAFLRLCFVHAASSRDQTIEEFFSSISLLFVSTPEQSKKNAIGLFGELCIIDSLLDQGLDAYPFWLMSGGKTKYEFCCRDLNVEVKTAPRPEPRVQLKHSQV
ncbi:MAG: hypothetical protein IJ131_08665, partial [Eggerthellaceae bacterium]|nr:hypothetical protein [Eggerthellaceae bacterium]